MTETNYTCPACGYMTFSEPPGSDAICPVCFWQDDLVDLEAMYEPMGPNKVSLEEAQINFRAFGASEKRHLANVRKPVATEQLDPAWRMLDRIRDIPKNLSAINQDASVYYWR